MKLRPQLRFVLIVLALIAPSAFAQSFYWNTASARSTALGGVYVPSSSDPLDALATNPAGLTSLSAPSVDLSVSVISRAGRSATQSTPTRSSARLPACCPMARSACPFATRASALASGFLPDLMSVADWHYVDAPGTAGATYGLQQQKSAILAGRFVAGFGFALNKKISLGATIGADYNSNTLMRRTSSRASRELQGLKTLLNLHTAGYGRNGSVGALIRPSRAWNLGSPGSPARSSSATALPTETPTRNSQRSYLAGDPSNFTYNAQVRNVLPQSALGSIAWYGIPRWVLAFQTDWVNWGNAFVNLPVIAHRWHQRDDQQRGQLNDTAVDGIPLNWKDQYSFHVGGERMLTERMSLRVRLRPREQSGSRFHALALTAAIMSNQISTGLSYQPGSPASRPPTPSIRRRKHR